MEWISDPIVVERVGNGLLAVFIILGGVGAYLKGKARPEPRGAPSGRMEIAGALIDGKDARELKAALDRNSVAMENTAGRWDKNTEAAMDVRDEVRELRSDIKAMTRELTIGNARPRS